MITTAPMPSGPLNLEIVESHQIEFPIMAQRFHGDGVRSIDDHKRLKRQHDRVKAVMKDEKWHTLDEIQAITGDPQASISRQIRYLTDPLFAENRIYGPHTLFKDEIAPGLWSYRIELSPRSPEAKAAENANRRFYKAKHPKPMKEAPEN